MGTRPIDWNIPEESVPPSVKVYDEGGKREGASICRFTVVFPDGAVYLMSTNAMSPIGFCYYAGQADDFVIPDHHKQRTVVPLHVVQRIRELSL